MVRTFIGFARGNSNCLEGDYFDIAYILSEYVYNIFVKCYVFMNENVIMNHLYNSILIWGKNGIIRVTVGNSPAIVMAGIKHYFL